MAFLQPLFCGAPEKKISEQNLTFTFHEQRKLAIFYAEHNKPLRFQHLHKLFSSNTVITFGLETLQTDSVVIFYRSLYAMNVAQNTST